MTGQPASYLDELNALAASGFTLPEAAKELSISYAYACKLARDNGVKLLRAGLSLAPSVREQQIAALFRSGRTLAEIGDQFGVTRERVRQVLKKFYGITAADGGQTKKAADKREKFEARRNNASLKKWGCNWDQYAALRAMKKPTRCYAAHRQNSKKRGIGFDLTLWQWWSIWQQSGKWALRGRGQGYMMCRVGDEGPYAVGNVFIATGCENSSNQKRKSSGLPRGVYKHKRCTGYTAFRMMDGVKYRLGTFPTPELAHAAYLAFTAPLEIAA